MHTTKPKPILRRDGHEKVTGLAKYSAEWAVSGILHAVPIGATIAQGLVTDVQTDIAEKAPGVKLILTVMKPTKVTEVGVFGESVAFTSSSAQSVGPLQSRKIVHAKQYVAVVVADTIENALHAASLVVVKYDSTPSQTDFSSEDLKQEKVKLIMGKPCSHSAGDPESALKAAPVSLDLTYTTPPNFHNPIEPHATIAYFDKTDKKNISLTVYDSSQSIVYNRKTLAKQFSLAEENVRVVCKFIGGAFGCKGATWPHVALAVLAARECNAPVKLVMQREHMYGGIGHRSPTRQRIALGAEKDGTLTAYIHEGCSQASILNSFVEPFTLPSQHMYAAENRKYEQHFVRLNTQNPTFMRAPGEVTGMFAIESAIDEMANELGIDPIDFRLKNEPKLDPTNGKPFSSRLLPEVLRKGARLFGWEKRHATPRQNRDGHWLIGYGVASATFSVNRWPCSVRLTMRIVDGELDVLVESATHEMGTGTTTAQSQFTAELLGLQPERIRMELGDTRLPPGALSGGSGTTASTGEAIMHAVDQLKAEIVKLADKTSPLSRQKPDSLEFDNAQVLVVATGKGESLSRLVQLAKNQTIVVEGKCDPMLEKQKFSAHSFGAQFCEVGVDEDFGLVRIRRMLGYFAAGKILNANTARSQFLGGMVMGVGQALLENAHWDHPSGRVSNCDLSSYLIPTNADIPHIDVEWDDTPDTNATISGAKGIGEIGIVGVSAAIANAVFNATGKRIRDLPITPEKLMR